MKRAVSRWPGRGLLRALRRDKRGVTVLEFAFVAPVLILILMFLFDTAYYLYARAILSGEVQAAGRARLRSGITDVGSSPPRPRYRRRPCGRAWSGLPRRLADPER